MTKEELIHFLEPYTDETQIVLSMGTTYNNFYPKYSVATEELNFDDVIIEKGEGFIEI